MNLSIITEQARYGELASLSAINKTDKAIVSYVNLALVALYNRFPLKIKEALIELQDGKTLYSFDGTDADVTVDGSAVVSGVYITPTEGVTQDGDPVRVNEDTDCLSIYTVGYDMIQVPWAVEDETLSLIFKTGPELIKFVDDGNGGAVDTDVPLPLSLLEALMAYISYRGNRSPDNGTGEDIQRYAVFTQMCDRAQREGVISSDSYQRNVEQKGFL